MDSIIVKDLFFSAINTLIGMLLGATILYNIISTTGCAVQCSAVPQHSAYIHALARSVFGLPPDNEKCCFALSGEPVK